MSNQDNIALIIDNNWEKVKSEMHHTWRKLTDKDINETNNYKDLVKKLQDVYSLSEEEISAKINTFSEKLSLKPNLTRMQELKEALYEYASNVKDKISKNFNVNSLQKNAGEMQSVIVKYVKVNPLKSIGFGVLATVLIKKMLTHHPD